MAIAPAHAGEGMSDTIGADQGDGTRRGAEPVVARNVFWLNGAVVAEGPEYALLGTVWSPSAVIVSV